MKEIFGQVALLPITSLIGVVAETDGRSLGRASACRLGSRRLRQIREMSVVERLLNEKGLRVNDGGSISTRNTTHAFVRVVASPLFVSPIYVVSV